MQQQSYESEYHSAMGPRESYGRSSRSSGVASSGGGRVLKIVTEMGANAVTGISPAFGANAASSILESREREKKEMQDLNDRLGAYIEKVRGLEAENRRLAGDLEALRGRWGKDTSDIKTTYDGELTEKRRILDTASKAKAEIEVQIARLQQELSDIKYLTDQAQRVRAGDKDKIEGYTIELSDAQMEIQQLRRRLEGLTDEYEKYSHQNSTLAAELAKARDDLDQETINRIDNMNQAQTLMEEIDFLRRVHDQEVKELEALASQTPADNREYFKNEIALAIRDIKNEYDAIASQNKTDMESWYRLKVQEVQSATSAQNVETNYQKEETKRLRDQINGSRGKFADLEAKNALLEKQLRELQYQLEDDQRQYETAINDRDAQIKKMRDECQALMMELQSLLDTKQILDAEIAIYRKMLEGEENRAGLRSMVEQVVKTHSLQQSEDTDTKRHVRGEVSSKTSFQRSAKGNVVIADANTDGKYIVLENTHRSKEEHMEDWKLKRKADGKHEVVFSFPQGFSLKAGKSVKIWANAQGALHAPPDQFVIEQDSWGVGKHVQTTLINKDGEERATHVQRTVESA